MPFISQSCAHKICLICFLLSISTSTNPNFLDYCDCPPNLFYSGASTIHFSQQQKLPFKISSADSINFLPKTHQWLYNICRTKSQLLPPLPCRTGPHLLVSISCHSSSLTMLQRCPSTYPAAPPKDCCVCLFVCFCLECSALKLHISCSSLSLKFHLRHVWRSYPESLSFQPVSISSITQHCRQLPCSLVCGLVSPWTLFCVLLYLWHLDQWLESLSA